MRTNDRAAPAARPRGERSSVAVSKRSTIEDEPVSAPAKPAAKKAPAKVAAKPATKAPAKKAPAKAGTAGDAAPEVVLEEEAVVGARGAEAAEGAEEESTDFTWDEEEEESEALRQARKDAEMTASADSVRAYLKQIGKVALLNAEEEVDLAKRTEPGLYSAERLRQADETNEKLATQLRRDLRW